MATKLLRPVEICGVMVHEMRINPAALRRFRREVARMSVTELASKTLIGPDDNKAPIARSHLSNIENGNRPATPEIIVALAEVLKVSPYALLGPEDPKAAVRELVAMFDLTADDLFPKDGPDLAVAVGQ